MHSSSFETEAAFQKLLADHPALLRLPDGADGELLLVTQELGIADEQGGSDRWNIDHLFLTKEGVPVLVEVKRASDTRARREVVAQMLDYASHGTAFWTGADIASRYQATATRNGLNPESRLQEFIGGADPEAFWRQVEANLRSGRIRMVFVADKIGKELRRIVEFLNEQMRPAEVLAIEVAQFTDQSGLRTLVPQLIGATERAQSAKAVTAALDPITASDWIESIGTLNGKEVGDGARTVTAFLQDLGLALRVAPSQKSAVFELPDHTGTMRGIFYLYRNPVGLQIGIQPLLTDQHDVGDDLRLRLRYTEFPQKAREACLVECRPICAEAW